MFKNSSRRMRTVPWAKLDAAKRNAPKSEAQITKIHKKLTERDSKKRKQLEALGIDYSFPGYANARGGGAAEAAPKAKRMMAQAASGTPSGAASKSPAGGGTKGKGSKKGSTKGSSKGSTKGSKKGAQSKGLKKGGKPAS